MERVSQSNWAKGQGSDEWVSHGRRRMQGATRAPGPLPSSDQRWSFHRRSRAINRSLVTVDMLHLASLGSTRPCAALPTTTCTPGWCGREPRAPRATGLTHALIAVSSRISARRAAAKPPMAATATAAGGGTSVARPRSADVLGVVILDAGKRSAAADDMLLSVASVYG